MTRDDLLATVHVLQPGDLLFVRVDRDDFTDKRADELRQLILPKVPAGVEVLVGDRHISLEQYRRVTE